MTNTMTNTMANTLTRYTVIALIDGLWAKIFTTTSQAAASNCEDESEFTFTDIFTTDDNDYSVYRMLVRLNCGWVQEEEEELALQATDLITITTADEAGNPITFAYNK